MEENSVTEDSFEEWMADMRKILICQNLGEGFVQTYDNEDIWYGAYEDGLTPEEAFVSEVEAWGDSQ